MKIVSRKGKKWKDWYYRPLKKENGTLPVRGSRFLRLVENPPLCVKRCANWNWDLHLTSPTLDWIRSCLEWVVSSHLHLLKLKDIEAITLTEFSQLILESFPDGDGGYASQVREQGRYASEVLLAFDELINQVTEKS